MESEKIYWIVEQLEVLRIKNGTLEGIVDVLLRSNIGGSLDGFKSNSKYGCSEASSVGNFGASRLGVTVVGFLNTDTLLILLFLCLIRKHLLLFLLLHTILHCKCYVGV